MGAAGVGSGGMLEAAFWYLCAGSGPRFTEEGTKVQGGGGRRHSSPRSPEPRWGQTSALASRSSPAE